MSILTQLSHLSITDSELSNLSDKEIIRIEKKLKAKVKLDEGININEVNGIIKVLTEHREELKLLLSDSFSNFRKIVENPRELIQFNRSQTPNQEFDVDFKQFIQDNFGEQLKEYYSICLSQNHYRSFVSFLFYKSVFSSEIQESIHNKILQKFEFGLECIQINASNLETKIVHFYNPYFFRSLNYLDSIVFEDSMNELTNSVVDNMKEKKSLVRVLFSMGGFISSDSSLKKVIAQNRNYAIEKGVGEQTNFKKFPKGGTTRKIGAETKFSGGNLIWIIVVVLLFGVRLCKLGDNSSSSYTPKVDMSHIISMMENHSKTIDYFVENQSFIQYDSVTILSERNIKLNKNSRIAEFKRTSSDYMTSNLTVTNSTEKALFFVTQTNNGLTHFCLLPNSEIVISDDFDRYTIYMGENPKEITYINELNNVEVGLKFDKFSSSDSSLLQNIIKRNNDFNPDNKHFITISNDGVIEKTVEIEQNAEDENVTSSEFSNYIRNIKEVQMKKAISSRPVPFERDSILYFLDSVKLGMTLKNVLARNRTNKPVILILDTRFYKTFVFIKPNEFKQITSIMSGYRVYSGNKPSIITYLDDMNQERTAFRFEEFSTDNMLHLLVNKSFTEILDFRNQYTLDIYGDYTEFN